MKDKQTKKKESEQVIELHIYIHQTGGNTVLIPSHPSGIGLINVKNKDI